MTPEERVRIRVDALDAAVRTQPYLDSDATSEQIAEADTRLLGRAAAFERWLCLPVDRWTPAGQPTPYGPTPPDPGVPGA